MKKEQFIKIIKVLTTSYDKEFNQEQVEIWYSFFVNEDYENLKKAIKNIVLTNKYFPSIAEIKEEIANLQTQDIPKAEEQWEEVIESIHRYGEDYRVLESLKPYTAYIAKHVGLQNIRMADVEKQTWNKKEFIGEYNELKDKEIENIQIGNGERAFLLDNMKLIEGE